MWTSLCLGVNMKIWLAYLSGRQRSSQISSNVERIGAHVVFWLSSCYSAISITRSISKCHMVMCRESKANGRSRWYCDDIIESDALPQAEKFQPMSLRHSHNKNNSTQWECFVPTPDVYIYKKKYTIQYGLEGGYRYKGSRRIDSRTRLIHEFSLATALPPVFPINGLP
jgi:hypothetical protein